MADLAYDPFDPDVRANPYPLYARLRREAPLFRAENLGLSVVSRYEDVVAVLRDPDAFSSRAVRDLFSLGSMASMGDEAGIDGETLLGSDPPVHTRLRRIVNRAFTPRRVAALEPRARQVAEALIGAFAERGSCELIAELAAPLPVTMIAEILGVDAERRQDFLRWSHDFMMVGTGRPDPVRQASIQRSDAELGQWIDEVVAARRARPGDDLISALVAAERSEPVMTREEVENLILILLVAGTETTTHLIANALLALLAHPTALESVRRDPRRLASAVEEALRYDGPVQLTVRRATRDVELPGGKFRQGDLVAPLLGSANRDERRFAEPDRFDIARDSQGHVAFGLGAHFCVGAPLARLEARIALDALLGRVGALERLPEPLEYTPSLIIRGPRRLPLRFEPEPA